MLEASGINAALKARDIQDGDTVVIGEMELEWSHDQVLHQSPSLTPDPGLARRMVVLTLVPALAMLRRSLSPSVCRAPCHESRQM